jgi:hypothetical protein
MYNISSKKIQEMSRLQTRSRIHALVSLQDIFAPFRSTKVIPSLIHNLPTLFLFHANFWDVDRQWPCLRNQPKTGNATHLKSTLQATFSMDEQCRMEFGEG